MVLRIGRRADHLLSHAKVRALMSFIAVYLGLVLSVIVLIVVDLNLKNGIFQ